MTNEDLYRLFRSTYPEIKPVDYRPAESMFVKGRVGITIWTDNGDMLMYFPNQDTLNRRDASISELFAKMLASNTIVSNEVVEKLLNNEEEE